MREHPGLARAGAGHDQQRPVDVGDGVPLDGVQPLEEGVVGGRHGPPTLPAACDTRPLTATVPPVDGAPGRRRRAARQPQPAPARLLRRHRVRHAEPRPARRPLGALHEPPHRLAAVHAGPPRPARRRPRLPVAAVGLDRGVGGRRSPTSSAATPASPRCSCPTTRTCSRRAARTTTPTSAAGTTCAATRTTRGAPGPTRRGSARRRCPAGAAPWARGYDISRTWFRDEADFPGPQTMAAAAALARRRARRRPRRPTSAPCSSSTSSTRTSRSTRPSRGPSRYDPDWEGARLIWPPYARNAEQAGLDRARGPPPARAVRRQALDDRPLARAASSTSSTATTRGTPPRSSLCTDHGHYLGERDIWGKPQVPVHPELGHIPLLVAWPGVAPGTCDALTTTVDLHATLCDVFGVTPEHRTHGHSLVPLLDGHGDVDPRVGAVRRLGPRGPRRRRHPHLRPGAGRGEPAAVDVVEPLVDDAGPRLPRRPPAPARRPGRARPRCRAATCR